MFAEKPEDVGTVDGETGDDVGVEVDQPVGKLECDLLPAGTALAKYNATGWRARLLPSDLAANIAAINQTSGRALIVPNGPDGTAFNVSGQFQVECTLVGPDNETLTAFNRTITVNPSKRALAASQASFCCVHESAFAAYRLLASSPHAGVANRVHQPVSALYATI